MKALVLSMLAMASIAAMTSCSNENDPIDEAKKNEKVEIKLTAGIGAIETNTKAPILPGEAVTGVCFVRQDGETPDWAVNANTCTADIASTSGAITFSSPQYYPQDLTAKVNLIGYYPSGSIASGKITYSAYDGTQDIMCTKVSTLTRGGAGTSTAITFEHKLTQLQFKVVAENAAAIEAWGKITKIELVNQQSTAELNLSDQTILFTGDATATYNVLNNSSGIELSITTSEVIGNPILAKAAQNKYSVKVYTEKKTEGLVIDLKDVAGVASNAYTVLLTFKGMDIVPTGTIGTWTPGGGSGELQ